jgi:hypothetical protein
MIIKQSFLEGDFHICRQFHQRFMHVVFVQNFGAKNSKAKTQLEKSRAKHFRTKNACVKC